MLPIGLLYHPDGSAADLFSNLLMTCYGRPIPSAVATLVRARRADLRSPVVIGYIYAGWPAPRRSIPTTCLQLAVRAPAMSRLFFENCGATGGDADAASLT